MTDKPEVRIKAPFWLNFLLGGVAGSVAKSTIAPLDRGKIIFQTSHRPYSMRALFDVLQQTYTKHGFFSLWRGNSATVTRIFPYAAVQYSAHEKYKQLLHVQDGGKFRRFLAGAMAGATSVAVTYPFDFARARMAVTHRNKYRNIIDVLRVVQREEGLSKIYRGFTPTIIGCIPYSGTAFYTFETLKLRWQESNGGQKLETFPNFVCGAIAGVVGQSFTYPLDIVRRRMQTGHVTGYPEYAENFVKTIRLIVKNEGVIGGLYKGLSLNWIKGPIASGISFTLFHQLQSLFVFL